MLLSYVLCGSAPVLRALHLGKAGVVSKRRSVAWWAARSSRIEYVERMRTMQIDRFPGEKIEITDLGSLIIERLTDERVVWPQQAVPLVGYMAWPNDAAARGRWLLAHQDNDQSAPSELIRKLKIIQQHWARVADIVHLYFDLVKGRHQERRGGASVGKAISLIKANAKSKGTGTAKLWEVWKTYKDVAHLVTAAVLVSGEAQTRHQSAPFAKRLAQFQPYRMAMLVPELVISVAMTFENDGLSAAPSCKAPLFDPESLWRIPVNINLTSVPPPDRKITTADLAVLSARRAGNRGRANRRWTTPVFD